MPTRSTVQTPYQQLCFVISVIRLMFRFRPLSNRSDIAGGSTLGNISNTQVALNTVDIGLPQLAMHSPYETAGVKDTEYLVQAAQEFFN